MRTIIKTDKTELIKASAAAEIYGTTTETIKALKLGQQVEVEDEIANKMIEAGHAQEVN